MTIETRLAEIRANREKANDMVDRLCGDPSRWTLSVPVRDDDSDMILTQVTDKDLPALLAAVVAVMELADRLAWEAKPANHLGKDLDYCRAATAQRIRTAITTALEVQG